MSRRKFLIVGLVVLILAASAVNFVLIGGAVSNGQNARETQCRTFPISLKLYAAAYRYHLISLKDLRVYEAAAPRNCPPRP